MSVPTYDQFIEPILRYLAATPVAANLRTISLGLQRFQATFSPTIHGLKYGLGRIQLEMKLVDLCALKAKALYFF